MLYLWELFCEINHFRSSGFSVGTIDFSQAISYFSLINFRPSAWEISILKQLDSIFLKVKSTIDKEEQNKKKNKYSKS
jgi:hypothetical protein